MYNIYRGFQILYALTIITLMESFDKKILKKIFTHYILLFY